MKLRALATTLVAAGLTGVTSAASAQGDPAMIKARQKIFGLENVDATTGAVIASEAQRRNSGYYWWRGGCYYRYPNGSWLQVQPGYCY